MKHFGAVVVQDPDRGGAGQDDIDSRISGDTGEDAEGRDTVGFQVLELHIRHVGEALVGTGIDTVDVRMLLALGPDERDDTDTELMDVGTT